MLFLSLFILVTILPYTCFSQYFGNTPNLMHERYRNCFGDVCKAMLSFVGRYALNSVLSEKIITPTKISQLFETEILGLKFASFFGSSSNCAWYGVQDQIINKNRAYLSCIDQYRNWPIGVGRSCCDLMRDRRLNCRRWEKNSTLNFYLEGFHLKAYSWLMASSPRTTSIAISLFRRRKIYQSHAFRAKKHGKMWRPLNTSRRGPSASHFR